MFGQLVQDAVERTFDAPIWIVMAQLCKVSQVADVISLAVLIDVFAVKGAMHDPLERSYGLED